eukprot:603574_1
MAHVTTDHGQSMKYTSTTQPMTKRPVNNMWIVSVGQLENQYRGRGLSIKYVDNEDEEHPHQFTCFCGVCNASIVNGRIYDWNDARSRINVKQCLDHHYNTDGNTHWSWANATKDEHGTISRAKIAYKAMVGQFMHNLEDS